MAEQQRPKLSANGIQALVQEAIFDMRQIAGALESERTQVLKLDPDNYIRMRRFVAMEIGYQREKLITWAQELEREFGDTSG